MRFLLIPLALTLLVPTVGMASDISEATEKYCDCAKPLYQDMEKMMAAVRGGDMSGLQNMQANMQTKMARLQSCMADLQEEYSDKKGDKDFEAAMKDQIEKVCPVPNVKFSAQG